MCIDDSCRIWDLRVGSLDHFHNLRESVLDVDIWEGVEVGLSSDWYARKSDKGSMNPSTEVGDGWTLIMYPMYTD